MYDLKPLELTPQESFDKLQKRASAFAGFDLSKPVDLSELMPDVINSEAECGEYGQMSFKLTTKLRGHLVGENGNDEELIITIVRKNVKKLPRPE